MAGSDPRIGGELGDYRLDSLVGRGGMGVVYRAFDRRLGRTVALKLLPPELGDDEGFRERFLRESRQAAALDHHNVIPIYEAGEVDGTLFIAMRFVETVDLRAMLVREQTLPVERALAISRQVASALDAAHARGLVHRDVKPGNILLSSESGPVIADHVYLSDFGLAKVAGSRVSVTSPRGFLGTIDYAAPEQIEGEELDGRADQYALACVLCECLTGLPPYAHDSELAVLWAHMSDDPPSLHERRPELPAALDAVVARALAKDPADRFPSCTAFADAARAAVGPGDGSAHAPVLAPAAAGAGGRRSRRRSRAYALLAALVLAGAATGLVLGLSGRGQDGGSQPPTAIAVDSVSSLDPMSLQFRTTLEGVGARPTGIAISPDGLWVASFDARTVSRIDPERGREVWTAGAGGTPTGIAFGEGGVWVTNEFEQRVTRIDPATGTILASIDSGSGVRAVAAGEGAIWVANRLTGTLLRIDPATNGFESIPVGSDPTGVAVSSGSVWVANSDDRTVSRVDSATREVAAVIPLRSTPSAIAAGPAGIWVASFEGDVVSRIDPGSNRVASEVEVGDGPQALAVAEDAVWVTTALSGTLARVDAATGDVTAIDVGHSPDGVAIAPDGTVWFTVHAL